MKLSETSIRRPILASMLNLGLVIAGLIMLFRLPVRELPDVDPPLVRVTTVFPGASAEVVETEVTERLEEVINSIEGIKLIESTSREQVSEISVEFNLARDIDLAAQDVRDRVSRVRGNLPDDIDEPIVAKEDSDARPMLWVAFFSENYSTLELTTIAENVVKDRLQTVSGVSSVIIGGSKRFAIRLRLDPFKMAAKDITVADIEEALREQNVELPSGRIENLERELSIETKGELKTADEFNRLVIKTINEAPIRLSDVGRAETGVEDERSIARYKSKPSVGLGIVKQSKANTVSVADGVIAEVARLKPILPKDVETFVAYDESIYVRNSIREVWITLGISFLLVVFVIYLFLGDKRATLVPSLTIPIATLSTFAILAAFGYSINILTMLALVLAIGLVVDDSIVVLENIFRHIEEGMKPLDAAFTAMKEIAFAVVATTVALVAVFIPLAFQTSITGRLFVEFAIALCGAVVVSSFVALTLTPSVSGRILKRLDSERELPGFVLKFHQYLDRLTARYLGLLDKTLRNPRLVFGGLAVIILLTFGFYGLLQQEFLPVEDKGRIFSLAIAPEGATSEYTDRIVRKMEHIVSVFPEVEGYFSAVALARGSPGKANEGLMFVRLHNDRKRSAQDMMAGPNGIGAQFFGNVEGAIAIPLLPKAIGGGFGQEFQLVLQYDDLPTLDKVAQEIADELKSVGYLRNVRSTFEYNKPQLLVEVDRERAATLGISVRNISRTLQILFGGLDLSTIKLGGKEYDVIVQLEREARLTPEALNRLYVRTAQGNLVQLSNVLNLKEAAGPNAILRFKRLRSAVIEATPVDMPLGTVIENVEEILAKKLPPTFRYDWKGEARDLQETGTEAVWVIVLAIVIVYMVLAAQFESLVDPFTVMLTLPLAAFGAFGALLLCSTIDAVGFSLHGWANYAPDPPWIAHLLSAIVPRIPAMTINLFSLIGMTLLIGLVTKNSILLVEFANQLREKGVEAGKAIREAARLRLRPILMTAFSTLAGILPIAIGFGAGAESRRPMGIVAVGGMLVGTILTLFVVPVFYVYLAERFEKKKYSVASKSEN